MIPRRSVRDLSRNEWRMLCAVLPVVVAVRIALGVMPFRSLVQRLREVAERLPSPRPASRRYRETLSWAVQAVGRRLLGSRPCLTQALVVQFFLWRRGTETELRIGVNKDRNGALLAHAWVVLDGEVIIGGHLSEMMYSALPDLQNKIQQ